MFLESLGLCVSSWGCGCGKTLFFFDWFCLGDWVVQRLTALIIGAYAVFILLYFVLHGPMHYTVWRDFFSHLGVQCATFIVSISIVWHAWIGLWTVFTDYVKPLRIRFILETMTVALLLGYVACVVIILWL